MFKKDLTSILGTFAKTLNDLKTFVEDKEAELLKHAQNLEEIAKAKAEAELNKARASKIIENLGKLLEAA